MTNGLLKKEILDENLFNDLTTFSQEDKNIIPDIFITNYLYFSSFFASNRVRLQVGDQFPTNSNLFALVVANTGKGKSYANKFFIKTVYDIQQELDEEYKKRKKFVDSCRYYANNAGDLTPDMEREFVSGYNKKHKTGFKDFALTSPSPHIFTTTDFTPENLAVLFNGSKNNTILLNCDEFEQLKTNIERTKTVDNIFTFLTSYFDGKSDFITRKSQDPISSKDGKIALLANTVNETFAKLKESGFFSSGLGFRYLFYVNEELNLNDFETPVKAKSGESIYDKYQMRFSNIIRNFFFEEVYMTEGIVNLRINEDGTLKLWGELINKLWYDHIKNNESLKDTEKEGIRSRLPIMLNKCILNTFLMNHSYANRGKQTYPISQVEMTETDILRGYHLYNYFLTQMTSVFDNTVKSDLTEKEMLIIELMEVDRPYPVDTLKKNAVPGKASERTFSRFISKKSNQFEVVTNRSSNKRMITRLF